MKKHKKGKAEQPKQDTAEKLDECLEVESQEKDIDVQKGTEIAKEPEKKERSKEEEYYDRLIRMAADFDNFKKRVVKEKSDYVRFSTERLIKEIIPVVDNLERGLESAKSAKDKETIVTGIELTLNQILAVLKKEGVETIESRGKEFDPLIHEAISQIPTKEVEPNTVIEEQLKAYLLNKKLIRPARVVVSKEVIEEQKTPEEKEGLKSECIDSQTDNGNEEI